MSEAPGAGAGAGAGRVPGPVRVVVMGVSAVGKSTVGTLLAAHLGASFVDGDDLHPAANVAKMASGIPLTDEDRWPWLDAVAATLAAGAPMVVASSALRRVYRDRILAGAPGTVFVHLAADPAILRARANARTDHFMPPALLDSQLATLEPLAPDEPGWTVDVSTATPASAAADAGQLVLGIDWAQVRH